MPYIDFRGWIDTRLAVLLEEFPNDHWITEGEVNYMLTRILLAFLGDAPSYTRFNAAIGVLECAKLELYRRMVAPYEDGKRAANGDVYPASEQAIRDAASAR